MANDIGLLLTGRAEPGCRGCCHGYIGPVRSHRAAKRRRLAEKPIQTMETVPGSDRAEMVIDLGYGLSSGLISPHLLAARAYGDANTVHTG
jgi:hypothetical protein